MYRELDGVHAMGKWKRRRRQPSCSSSTTGRGRPRTRRTALSSTPGHSSSSRLRPRNWLCRATVPPSSSPRRRAIGEAGDGGRALWAPSPPGPSDLRRHCSADGRRLCGRHCRPRAPRRRARRRLPPAGWWLGRRALNCASGLPLGRGEGNYGFGSCPRSGWCVLDATATDVWCTVWPGAAGE